MNNQLINLLPHLSNALANVLRDDGHSAVADKLGSAVVEKFSYYSGGDVGYVYLVQNQPVRHGETPAFSTIRFADPDCNIDLRESGELFGIELLTLSPEFIEVAGQKW